MVGGCSYRSCKAARTASCCPRVVRALTVTMPKPHQPVIAFEVPISAANGSWIVLRVSDPGSTDINPGQGNKAIVEDSRARGTAYQGLGPAIAYTSPFFLTAKSKSKKTPA